MGDLAYRIVTDSRDMCMQLIQQSDWQTLYDNDQLHAQQVRGWALQTEAGRLARIAPPSLLLLVLTCLISHSIAGLCVCVRRPLVQRLLSSKNRHRHHSNRLHLSHGV